MCRNANIARHADWLQLLSYDWTIPVWGRGLENGQMYSIYVLTYIQNNREVLMT